MWFGIWLKAILHTQKVFSNENSNYSLGLKLFSFKLLLVAEDDKTYSCLVIQEKPLLVILRLKPICF